MLVTENCKMIINNNLLQFALLNVVIQTCGLKVHPSIAENNITITKSTIRNVVNELFIAVKLIGIEKNTKLKQYLLIHKFFSMLTSKDHDYLNQIAIESKTDLTNINNETREFMDGINAVLDKDPGNYTEEPEKDYLYTNVNNFLKSLEYLKDKNGLNDNYYNINHQILNILLPDRLNTTQGESNENDSLISDNEFWVPDQSGRRIYQGDKTKIKFFPFMASIQIFNSFQCGGCIIKSDLVITAASCLQLAWNNRFFRENPAFLSVRVGSTFYKGGGESIAVLEVYFHPEYDPKTLKNNICILRLVRRIKFKRRRRNVKKIDFDRNPSNLPMTTDGITIVGWGAKGVSNLVRDPWSNRLTFSVLDIYPLRECQDIYSSQYVTQKNFCAGFFSKGGGACNGDVGGPGIVSGILAGIVSFGSPVCGTPDAPTVFTKLGYYTDWIENIIEQEVPSSRQKTTLRTPYPPITHERYNTLKPTTFKLEPIFGKFKPVPINQVDPPEPESDVESLRILDDEKLIKEFLSTMFESKEAKQYEDIYVNDATETKDIKRFKIHPKRPKPQSIQLSESEIEMPDPAEFTEIVEDTTESFSKFTAIDNNNILLLNDKESDDDDDEIEKNILKLIENIDVDSEEVMKGKVPNVFGNQISKEVNDYSKIPQIPRDVTMKNSKKNTDDSILTLLYLSDSEKNGDMKAIGNVIEDFDENVNEGLSIAVDGFKDLTFRDNGTGGSFYNFLPKNEMYELLAEAIDDVAEIKENPKR